MNRIISRNKSYVVQDKKTNQGGDNIGRIVIMEFKAQDSTAFDDMLAFVKQHPDFEKLEISYEPTLSLSGLEINLSRRRVINNGQEIELTVKGDQDAMAIYSACSQPIKVVFLHTSRFMIRCGAKYQQAMKRIP